MRRVVAYIDANLDGDLSLEAVAAVAAFSRHHFHRQFAALFGLSLHRYVTLARMRRAGERLAFRGDDVAGVAFDSGYEAPEAFARAFRDALGQSPSAFRRAPDWAAWGAMVDLIRQARSRLMTAAHSDADVRIVEFPETRVAVLSHRGAPDKLGDSIRRFIAWRRRTGCIPPLSATFNLLYTDPETVAPEEYRIDLCAGTDRPVAENGEGVVAGAIPGGRYAVLRVSGPTDSLRQVVSFLYADWLPRSGEELRDTPPFVQRYADAADGEPTTDLYLPLR